MLATNIYFSSSSENDDAVSDKQPHQLEQIVANYVSSSSQGSASDEEEEEAVFPAVIATVDKSEHMSLNAKTQLKIVQIDAKTDLGESDPLSSSSHRRFDAAGCRCSLNEDVDDREAISTLRLEEKIVSLMNRVWILETENDVLRSRWTNEDEGKNSSEDIVKELYQDPYNDNNILFKSSSIPEAANLPLANQSLGDRGRTSKETCTETTRSKDMPSLVEENRSLRTNLKILDEIKERMGVAMVSLEQRDKLRGDIIQDLNKQLDDEARKHKEVTKSLQSKLQTERSKNLKLQSGLDEERRTWKTQQNLFKELEATVEKNDNAIKSLKSKLDTEQSKNQRLQTDFDEEKLKHENAMKSLQRELDTEQFKNKRLQTDLEEEKQKHENTKISLRNDYNIRQPEVDVEEGKLRQHMEKECIDGNRSGFYSPQMMDNNSPSAQTAAQLISDLSNELRLTMERESKLKDEFNTFKRQNQATQPSAEFSFLREHHEQERKALMEYNEELESLNIELARKLVALETQHNQLVERTKQEKNKNADHASSSGVNSGNDSKLRELQDYLQSLSIKYERSKREITSLKALLATWETSLSPTKRRLSPYSNETFRPTTSITASQTRVQNQSGVHVESNDKEKDKALQSHLWKERDVRFSSKQDFATVDLRGLGNEQREEKDHTDGLFPNRVEI